MRKRLSGGMLVGVCVAICGLIGVAMAQWPAQQGNPGTDAVRVVLETPRWLHSSAISPDGQSMLLTIVLPEEQKILVYEVDLVDRGDTGKGMLHFRSTRPIHGDIQLRTFNEQPPTVHEIEELVQRQGR